MSRIRILLLASAAFLAPSVALAQTTPPPPPPADEEAQTEAEVAEGEEEAADTAVEGVTVTGRANDIRTSIDSVSYSTAEDLQAATGTLADALRNIPSVEVDPQGNVSLRGDPTVTILIDGRPSAILSGEGRGPAILQMSADQFSRIEVMTNPSAAYRPDGSGGVINLITRPNFVREGATTSGSLRANVGTDGRYNFGGNIAWSRDRLTLTGEFGWRHDGHVMETNRLRERVDIPTGDVIESRQSQVMDTEIDGRYLRLGAEYRLTDDLQLTGELRRQQFESGGDGVELIETDDASGALASAIERRGFGGFRGEFTGVTARVLRTFGEGHEWSNELRYDVGENGFDQDGVTLFALPAAPSVYEDVSNGRDFAQLYFASAYTRPMPDEGKLRAGYEAEVTDVEFDNQVLRGPSPTTLVVDPTVTNRFQADQSVHAIYGTYERPLGPVSAQVGLRVEYVTLDLDQITSGVQVSNDYFRVYPSFHIVRQLSETQELRGSYSRRVQRPGPGELNPFLVFQDPLSYRSGNPDLEPQVTDSFELTWLSRANQTFYQATLYYRDTSDAFTQVASDIGGGVLLTRPENLGSSRSVGVEFVANGRLHPTLRYNASVNLYNQQIDASGIAFGQDAEATTVSGRINLNWQPTPKDFVQIGGFWTGETVFAQGRREPSGMVNLGYRRTLNDRLALQVTVRDLFNTFGDETIYETPNFTDRTERVFGGRVAFIGLTWTFGQPQRGQQQPAFDFSAPQTGQ